MQNHDPILTVRYRALALNALARPVSPFRELPDRMVIVDVAHQRMGLLEHGLIVAEYRVSTAEAGLGCEEGSYKTPPGWHRIHAKIGADAPTGMIFRARTATGEIWRGEARQEDLILTRVLTLDGLEEGVNHGPGRDSLERFIYVHGTNQEDQIGQPLSHGCVRMRNADVVEFFDAVREGDVLLVDEGNRAGDLGRLHFAGVAGSGMSALAQYWAMRGGRASGSDRAFDRGERPEDRSQLEKRGVEIFPQNGSGVQGDCSAVVYSTAVEETVPDFAEARRLGVPLLHRSELLAHFVENQRTIAVTGTSGKSTTVAMIFEILRSSGLDPSVITGGDLLALQKEGLWGNAWAGASDLLVIEADESDGSLVRYHPAVGVVLNLQRDHKEMDVVSEMFRSFQSHVRENFVVGEPDNLSEFSKNAIVFGFGAQAKVRATNLEEGPATSTFMVDDVVFRLSVPGHHNVENVLAAIAACKAVGVPLAPMAPALASFQGVERRFQVLGIVRGIQVVDDFAHNPAKVAASLCTAHLRAKRVLAIYQPHGYGPTRFLRQDFIEAFAAELASEDRLWWLEVYYAGGTATRDFSSADIVAEIAAKGSQAEFAPSREWLVERITSEARAGDLVIVMGARDPSLTELAKSILSRL